MSGTSEIRAEVGSFVKPDGWTIGETLTACDDWSEAPFRIHAYGAGLDLAVRIEVTGRKVRWDSPFSIGGGVRVRITFVGDGEADEVTSGWMLVR